MFLLAAGLLGALSMAVLALALRWARWELIPLSKRGRVAWWRDHITIVLVGSVCAAAGGVLTLTVAG